MPLTPISEAAIRKLHADYCALVGELPLTLDRIYWWGQWAKNGWGSAELVLVIRYLQAEVKKGKRFPGALRWSNLIQQSDNFAEELILARGALRNAPRQPSAKERVIAQARPEAFQQHDTSNTAKPIGEYVQKALAELRRVTQ